MSIYKYKNLKENKVLCPISIFSYFLRILSFRLGNLYFKFGSETSASVFLGLYILYLDNSVVKEMKITEG
jgi:hypothetical protein